MERCQAALPRQPHVPIVDRFGTGYVTDQVRQHYADPGKFNGYA